MSESDSIFKGLMVVALQYEWWHRATIGAIIGASLAVFVPYLWSKSSTDAAAPKATAAPAQPAVPDIEISGNSFKNIGTIVRSDQKPPSMSMKDNKLDDVGKIFDLRSDPKK